MSTNIRIFENKEFGSIRTVLEGDKILFCGKDIAQALGYSKPRNAIESHCKGALKQGILTNGGIQELTFIPEGDVYRLIIRSKLPSAQKFEHWVFDEVLPTIRETGGYLTPDALEKAMTDPDFTIGLLNAIKEKQQKIKELENEKLLNEPKVKFADRVIKSETNILIGDFAKVICNNDDGNVNMGRTRLFAILRDCKILNSKNIPYQKYIDRGYFLVKESPYRVNDKEYIAFTPIITPKGQVWLTTKLDKFIDKSNNIELERAVKLGELESDE